MKDKIKLGLLSISLCYIVLISFFSIKSYNNYLGTIDVSTSDDYKEELKKIKPSIDSISNDECKNYLNYFLENIEAFDGEDSVSVKKYFNKIYLNSDGILTYYQKGQEVCNGFSSENAKKHDLLLLFMTASIQDDEILQSHLFNYELRINDRFVRDILYAHLSSAELNIKKETSLKILKILVDLEKKYEVNNEN